MPAPVAEGEIVAGKYRVERVLGEGGMGIVVSAWHEELEKRVAIKFLLAPIAENPAVAERFRREARAAAKIGSEHVTRVLDVGTLPTGVPFMVMEFLEGRDLGEELTARKRIPAGEAIDFVLQACEALAEAHVNSIVHRDLKPENLFLTTRADGSRMIKVLDFGVSKSLIESDGGQLNLTRTSVLVGSPLYMSPEQLDAAKDIDQRADIWALGVILYELVSGEVPFSASSIAQLVNAVMQGAPRPLSELGVAVPPGLEDVIHRALEKDRSKRYASVAELARALGEFAPANSAASVVRISRVLGTTDVSAPLLSEPFARTQVARSDATLESRASTMDSWGRTSDPRSSTAPPRKRWLWPLALAAVPLLGGGAYFAFSSSPPGPSPPVEEAVAVEALQPSIPATTPTTSPPEETETETEAAETPAAAAADEDGEGGAKAEESNETAVKPQRVKPSPPRPTRPAVRRVRRKAPPAPEPTATSVQPTATPPADKPTKEADFGGRR